MEAARKSAGDAWRKKNYRLFVDTLAPFADELEASEKGRLNWESKRLTGDGDT